MKSVLRGRSDGLSFSSATTFIEGTSSSSSFEFHVPTAASRSFPAYPAVNGCTAVSHQTGWDSIGANVLQLCCSHTCRAAGQAGSGNAQVDRLRWKTKRTDPASAAGSPCSSHGDRMLQSRERPTGDGTAETEANWCRCQGGVTGLGCRSGVTVLEVRKADLCASNQRYLCMPLHPGAWFRLCS